MTRVFGRQQGLITRRTGDEFLILDTVRDRIHQLNPTAAFIWERLDDGLSDAEIIDRLTTQFDVNHEVAISDVSAVLAQFRALGFMT